MTTQSSTPTAADIAITVDAREFGLHSKQGGWRLGLLVARNVALAPGRVSVETLAPKTNATVFARKSNTSNDRIIRHLAAWERAAERGFVPHAADLRPGQDTMLLNGRPFTLDAETLPAWQEFYRTPIRRTPRPTPQARTQTPTPPPVTLSPAPTPTPPAEQTATERAIEEAGRSYRAGNGLPVESAGTVGAALRLHTEHTEDVRHGINAIRSYTRRLFDIARDTDWQTAGRAEAAAELRALAEQIGMVADMTEDPDMGRATDAAINQLINGS